MAQKTQTCEGCVHGGIFDNLDALLAELPEVWWCKNEASEHYHKRVRIAFDGSSSPSRADCPDYEAR